MIYLDIPITESAEGDYMVRRGQSLVGGAAPLAAGVLDPDGTLAANSDAKVATQKATKTYADNFLPLAGGTMTGELDFSAGAGIYMPPGDPVLWQPDNTASLRVGFVGAANGPQFQAFGNSNGSFPGAMFYDAGSGTQYFRFGPGLGSSLSLPGTGGTNIPDFAGWDVANTPTDPVNPTAWFRVQMDGADGYIPWHAA